MKSRFASIILIVLLVFACIVAFFPTSAKAQVNCSETYVIIANGIGAYGPNQIAERWADKYRTPENHVSTLDYPQSFFPLGPVSYDESTRQGSNLMYGQVRWNQENCPNSETVLIGHSAGARVVDDTVTRLAREGYDYNVKADVVANPKRVGGVESTLPGLYFGATMTGPHGSYGNIPVRDTCRQGDGICDLPKDPFLFVDGIAGYLGGKHIDYKAPATTPEVTEEVMIPDRPTLRLPDYVPTPIRNYLPVEVHNFIPKEILDYVPPPLPKLF